LFKEKLKLTQSETEFMETIAEALRREGREAGIVLGTERGTLDVARNMLTKHLAIELISYTTGLSVAQIKTLETGDLQAFQTQLGYLKSISETKTRETIRELTNLFKEKLKLTQSETEFMETISEAVRREGREAGIALGLERGLERGIVLGMERRTLDVAKNMLTKHLAIELISDITGLSVSQIKKLETGDFQDF
jgi:predicted transposase YdaD